MASYTLEGFGVLQVREELADEGKNHCLVNCSGCCVVRFGIPLPPYILRKVFEVNALGPDFGWTSSKKSCFQRAIGAKYSKDGTWRARADPGGVVLSCWIWCCPQLLLYEACQGECRWMSQPWI
jgi:hypothetical protein